MISICEKKIGNLLLTYIICLIKKLRGFKGFGGSTSELACIKTDAGVFFDARTAKFRGDFIGFVDSLWFSQKIGFVKTPVFLNIDKELFNFDLEQKIKCL